MMIIVLLVLMMIFLVRMINLVRDDYFADDDEYVGVTNDHKGGIEKYRIDQKPLKWGTFNPNL